MKSIFFLSAATFHWFAGCIEPGPFFSRNLVHLSCTVAVCIRDNGDILLVDSGFSEQAGHAPEKTIRTPIRKVIGLDSTEQNPIVQQLEALGFDRGQVKTIVATHCHYDHIGGLADFPNATLITTSDELNAMGNLGLQPFYRPADLAVNNPIRALDLSGPRKHFMPASLDLFGDGEVTLLDASGHTMGHLAVALRTDNAAYLHVGDAIFQDWESGKGCAGPSRLARFVCAESRALHRTIRNIQKLLDTPDAPQVIPTHDMQIFQGLPHTPEECM